MPSLNVLFVSLCSIEDFESQGIYTDLLKTFRDHGHNVFAIAPREKRTGLPTEFVDLDDVKVLRVSIGNIQKTNLIEKGVSTLLVKSRFLNAYNTYLADQQFDLIIYATPPTTIAGFIESIKKRTGAKAYLLLKDIFPQNSLDLGMLSKRGIKGLIYRFFKATEESTYAAADWIGCMSEANRDYLLMHEPQLHPECVEVNPNSLIPRDMSDIDAMYFKEKYGIPSDRTVFVYGGNLGRPQCVEFLIELLKLNEQKPVGFFLIAGSGTDRSKLENYFDKAAPDNAKLLPNLPRSEYDAMLCACDVGLILLDYKFTIPNFPSRMLSYMQASLPIAAATDEVCDLGRLAEENGFGIHGFSDSAEAFLEKCRLISASDIVAMGERSREYFESNYTSEHSYEVIVRHFDD